jgi:hypothetical protein
MAAKQHAEEALKDRTGGMDLAEAQAELLRAVAQLRAIEKLRKMKRAEGARGRRELAPDSSVLWERAQSGRQTPLSAACPG